VAPPAPLGRFAWYKQFWLIEMGRAAHEIWPDLEQYAGLEASGSMRALATRLTESLPQSFLRTMHDV
jgi:hypothetical protein